MAHAEYVVSVANKTWNKDHREIVVVPGSMTESDAVLRACVIRRLGLRGRPENYKMELYCDTYANGEITTIRMREVE